MLSQEQRSSRRTYRFRNGMTNLGTLIGYAKELTHRGGLMVQTQNKNHGLPFVLGQHDSMPKSVKENGVTKILGRIEGRRHEVTGDPTLVFRVLGFDNPRVIEMPPHDVWFKKKPDVAPSSEVQPTAAQFAPKFDQAEAKYNSVEFWGYISAIRQRKAGVVQDDGRQVKACIYLLIQQSADPNDAIPVRIYGNAVGSEMRAISIGMPVKIRGGSLRADVKPTGEQPEDGSPQPVSIHYFVQARNLLAVVPADYPNEEMVPPPEWAVAMKESSEADRRERLRQRAELHADAKPAKGAVNDHIGTGHASAQATPPAAGGETMSENALMQLIGKRPAAQPEQRVA